MNWTLSGLELEYRIVQLYSRDAGKRAATIALDVGQGTQDIGFRNDVTITFDCAPSTPVTFEVRDHDGSPTTASFHHPRSAGARLSITGQELLSPRLRVFTRRCIAGTARSFISTAGEYYDRIHARSGIHKGNTRGRDWRRADDALVRSRTLDRPGGDGLVVGRSSHSRCRLARITTIPRRAVHAPDMYRHILRRRPEGRREPHVGGRASTTRSSSLRARSMRSRSIRISCATTSKSPDSARTSRATCVCFDSRSRCIPAPIRAMTGRRWV